jgi:PKD repeat protein
LLVGVFAMMAIIVGVVVIGNVTDQADGEPLVEVNASATYTDLVLTHEGGDALAANEVAVIVRQGSDEWRYGLDSFAEVRGTGPAQFAGGERWNRTHDLAVGSARLLVVHGPSNTVVQEVQFSVPPEVIERPTARFEYTPADIGTGEQVTFNASRSSDPDGTVANYTWAFGDGTAVTTTDPVVNYTYSSPGEYDVALTVTDDDGATGGTTKTLLVNSPPTATFETDCTERECTFDPTNSTDDGLLANYTWDFGDGNTTTTTDSVTNHTYGDSGSYDVTLTVTDGFGATDTVTRTVEINDPPTATFSYTPDQPQEGEQITFDASNSSDPNGVITSYEWDFDSDGTTDATGETVDHTYTDGGEYTATLTVTDDDGVTNMTSQTVTVYGPPVATFSTTRDGDQVIVNATESYDPDGGNLTYRWYVNGTFGPILVEETTDPVTRLDIVGEDEGSTLYLVVEDDEEQITDTSQTVPYRVEVQSPGFGAAALVVAVVLGGWIRRRRRD